MNPDREIYDEVVSGWEGELVEQFPRERFEHLPATGSTNDDLLERLRKGEADHFDVIVADHQDSGRGRRGDRWEADAGRNLLFSVSFSLVENRAHWTRLPHLIAVCVGRALEAILGPGNRVEAKWPNDLMIDGKKIAGILVETVANPDPFAVVGIGLNVNMREEEFPEDLRPIATSLYEILGCESSRWYLLGLILREFLLRYPGEIDDFVPVRSWLEAHSFLAGKRLRVQLAEGVVEGVFAGFGRGGEMLLVRGDGRRDEITSAEKIWVCQD